jgi:hypothetical protein
MQQLLRVAHSEIKKKLEETKGSTGGSPFLNGSDAVGAPFLSPGAPHIAVFDVWERCGP